MVIRKRQILMATLVVALGAAVFVNWYYTKPTSAKTNLSAVADTTESANLGDSLFVQGTTTTADTEDEMSSDTTVQSTETQVQTAAAVAEYFADARLKRAQAHDEIQDAIEELLDNENATTAERDRATVYLNDFKDSVKLEADIENLITAKTGSECLVCINSENIQVVVEPGVLDPTVSLQIAEIVRQQAEVGSEKISIIEAK